MNLKPTTGFTLVELLISLALSTMVMTLLVGGFYQLSRNWEKQNHFLDEKIDNSLIMSEIEKALLGTFPYSYKDKKTGQKALFFEAGNKKLQWISTVSPSYDEEIMIWSIIANETSGIKLLVTPVMTGDPKKE